MHAAHKTRERMGAALAAAALPALLVYLLINGLTVGNAVVGRPDLQLITIVPESPSPPPEPHRARAAGAAAPPNLAARPAKIAAPVAPPAPTAPIPAEAGAASVPGPGAGAGGQGNGAGSGDTGEGDGDGGTPLRWIKGEIRDSDYPRDALRQGAGGTVGLRFTVGVKGRVTDCRVTRSSGNAELDATTCRLIMKRFRYEPTRDAQGRAVPDVVEGEHEWVVYRREQTESDAP